MFYVGGLLELQYPQTNFNKTSVWIKIIKLPNKIIIINF